MGKRLALLLLAGGVAFLDQVTKFWVAREIPLSGTIEVIPGVFSLTHIRNPGGAFGLLKDHPNILLTAAVATSVAILVYLIFRSHGWSAVGVGLALILGGAVGNLIDRFRLGYVVDFFHFRYWPQFNVADTAVTLGALGIALWMIRRPRTRRAAAVGARGVAPLMAEGNGAEAPPAGAIDPETEGG